MWLPGSRLVGGRWVSLRSDAPRDRVERSGTLATPTTVRGVPIAAGATIAVDPDFDHIHVTLAEATLVFGVRLPATTQLTFPGRVIGFAGLRLRPWQLALLPRMWRRRREARAVRVLVAEPFVHDGERFDAGAELTLTPDGRLLPQR